MRRWLWLGALVPERFDKLCLRTLPGEHGDLQEPTVVPRYMGELVEQMHDRLSLGEVHDASGRELELHVEWQTLPLLGVREIDLERLRGRRRRPLRAARPEPRPFTLVGDGQEMQWRR